MLDDAIAAWNSGISLTLRDVKQLNDLKAALKADGPGEAEVLLKVVAQEHQVTIRLPGRFKLSGNLRQRIRHFPGILSIDEL